MPGSDSPARPAPLPAPERLDALSGGDLEALRSALTRGGFGDQVADEAESLLPAALDAVRQPGVEWRLRRVGSPAALLTLLWIFSGRLPRATVEGLLGPDLVGALLGAGVLDERGDGIAARYRLTPLQGLLFLHDPFEGGPETAMGPGITTLVLARLIPPSAGAVLDVGCGAGTLALLAAARGARRAVGVDLSPRAVALSRFNARLNRLAAEFRAGDLLEPVRGERFDLVLSQPPYVVAPPGLATTTYLHGGPRGDELALRFAAAFPGALAEGGRAALFFDSARGEEPLPRRLRRALGPAQVSLAVLRADGPGLEVSAVAYASLEDPSLGARYRQAVARYGDAIFAAAPRGFARALVVLTRPRPGDPGFDAEVQVDRYEGVDAAALDRWLAGLSLLGRGDAALLAARVRPAAGARLVSTEVPGSGGDPARAVRFEGPSLARAFELSETGAAILDLLAGGGTVAEAEARLAEACGRPAETVRPAVLGFVRDGLGRGIVVVAGPEGTPGEAAGGSRAGP